MNYSSIDPDITAWIERNSLHLFTNFADREARFVYVSSNIGECFQISISEPQSSSVTIIACDIETFNDEEMELIVNVEQGKIGTALEDMLNTVYGWMKRRDASATRYTPNIS
jgi:hypothetical protein